MQIACSIDNDIINAYSSDWSNISGNASLVVKPKSRRECAIILKITHFCKILITVSAGRTNLTGSATPKGGIILSTVLLKDFNIKVNSELKHVITPCGIPLENLRNKVLELTKNNFYYPVDPTSRNDALVGGTLACNASGFIPGERGATRYWVEGVDFLLPNGDLIKAQRGDYISRDGYFELNYNNIVVKLPVPKYKRPKIKNASGLFSSNNGEMDFIDLVIGSEGILGLITACTLKLAQRPKDFLELFISLDNEENAIDLHDYLYNYFNGDLSKINALEYFGYNSQKYMKHQKFLFKKDADVGVYIQIPIYSSSMESKSVEWMNILTGFDDAIDLDSIIVLNDPMNWKKFFEARHSIPDNALRKTKALGGISIITDTIVPPENYKKYLNKIHNKLRTAKIEYLLFGHLGDCHLHFHLIPDKKQDKALYKIYDYMIDLSTKLGGVYSAEHGTGKRKINDFEKCYGVSGVKMIQLLKEKIDPNFLLNRGNVVNPL